MRSPGDDRRPPLGTRCQHLAKKREVLCNPDARATFARVRNTARRLLQRAGVDTAEVQLAPGASAGHAVHVLVFPDVYYPASDSALLAEALSAENLKPGAAVLDMCTGSGVLAVVAARQGAGKVTAVDVSRRALICTRLNALVHRAPVRARRGDLFAALPEGEMFDAVVSNPPWLPSATDDLPARGISRAWDAGTNGRALLDRVCAAAPARLRPGGFLLLVQSSICDLPATVEMLSRQGLDVTVVGRRVAPMTPLLRERAREMQHQGPWAPADSTYETVVIRASRPLPGKPQP
jgi:release factor glutamine methyltransferase